MTAQTGTILWLTGWSMPDAVFDRLRELLPEYDHVAADYSAADTPERMLQAAEAAVLRVRAGGVAQQREREGASGGMLGAAPELALSVEAEPGPAPDSASAPEFCGSARLARQATPPTESAPALASGSGRQPLLLAGWSLGALLALKLAADRGGADGLVLFAATARFTRSRDEADRGWADVYVRRMIAGLRQDRAAVEAAFRQQMASEAEEDAASICERPAPSGSWTTTALLAGLDLLRSEDVRPRLPHINCPVLLFHGTKDRICPYGAAEELQAGLPRADLIPIPDGGHAPFAGRERYIAEEWRKWRNEQMGG